jgi:hypothetical protein
MKCFSKDMMDILLVDLVIYLSPDFEIRTGAAIPKTMITPEENFIRQSVLADIPLNNSQQGFIPPGKTGTAETYYDFTPMIHCSR